MIRDEPAIEIDTCAGSTEEVEALVALFRRSYAPIAQVFQPRSRRRWAWKYGNGGARCASLAARADDRPIAHVGGLSYRWRHPHATARSIQATDHMVDPAWRIGLRAGKLFRRLMGAWVERFCHPQLHGIGWGFPSADDFRLGERFFGYASLGPVRVLVQNDLFALLRGHSRDREPEPEPERAAQLDPRAVDELWRRSSAALSLTHERDAAFLRWRYATHPTQRYELVTLLADDGALRALAVLRRGGLADDTATLLEWMVDPADTDAAASLLEQVARRARRLGCGALAVWCAPWRTEAAFFRSAGFVEHATALRHTARCFDARVTLAELREGCAWALGDVDFL
ncbi:MAG: hypothetical protein JNM84_03020 [Planctomycetes bacterium]|nr:hypothetical protein [Planctomycetota bacterium]